MIKNQPSELSNSEKHFGEIWWIGLAKNLLHDQEGPAATESKFRVDGNLMEADRSN
jgi:hypothetical protein